MPLTSQIELRQYWKETVSADLSTPQDEGTYVVNMPWTSGTGANQADKIFHDTRTLSASANEDLDLAGVLTNKFGATVTFVKIKKIIIKAAPGNTNNVVVTRPASNGAPVFLAAGDGISLPPGAWIAISAPGTAGLATVTAGTGDLLNIANSAGGSSVDYDVIIEGTSA